jgi:hypothetical protein
MKKGKEECGSQDSNSMAEVEPYWKSMWGQEAQLNEGTKWIRREESGKMGNMDLGPTQITKITSFLSKAHNWKSHVNE